MRIVVPVKPLALAKSRLGPTLSGSQRMNLMLRLFDRVIGEALQVAPVSVVTADQDVSRRALAAGAAVIDEGRATGLNAAARLAARRLRQAGEAQMLILAADLPDVSADALGKLVNLYGPGRLVITGSRDGGTNAMAMDLGREFVFAYGAASFSRHCLQGRAAGLSVLQHACPLISHDLDYPDDLQGRSALWAA